MNIKDQIKAAKATKLVLSKEVSSIETHRSLEERRYQSLLQEAQDSIKTT